MNFRIAIASKGRADKIITVDNLKLPHNLVDIWVDDDNECKLYKKKNPSLNIIVGQATGITNIRNAMLKHYGQNNRIVMMCDDIESVSKLSLLHINRLDDVFGNDLLEFIESMFLLADKSKTALWSVYPVANHFFMKKRINPVGFCIGTFCGITISDIIFDKRFELKEDYDFTLAHIVKYGRVVRNDSVCVKAKHYTNSGGCVAYRTTEKEQSAIKLLLSKYPAMVRRNAGRPNEVLITL